MLDIAVAIPHGKGQLIYVSIPLGLGADERPHPVLAQLLREIVEGLTPITVVGDVEWAINRLDDGSWVVVMLNNSGVEKPQHGIVPTRHEEARSVRLEAKFAVAKSEEWLTNTLVTWKSDPQKSTVESIIPAGAARLIMAAPAK